MKEFYEKLDEYIELLEDKKNDYKILCFVVDELGYIPDETLDYIAKKIDVFKFSLEGTIKFYPKLQKVRTKHYVQICIGRNCVQKGLKEKIEELRGKVDFVIEERNCLGHCSKPANLSIGNKNYRYSSLLELETILLNLK
ncbi:NAD(P)H-dependent oxidoreductase subunit E [Cetobacterium sp.]|uniref:NAD(P)H-dependent oxidoreductase subunit E n=2 Tax=Cetobacterium sp. TaxID=2071632 RepID=UPI002FCBA798